MSAEEIEFLTKILRGSPDDLAALVKSPEFEKKFGSLTGSLKLSGLSPEEIIARLKSAFRKPTDLGIINARLTELRHGARAASVDTEPEIPLVKERFSDFSKYRILRMEGLTKSQKILTKRLAGFFLPLETAMWTYRIFVLLTGGVILSVWALVGLPWVAVSGSGITVAVLALVGPLGIMRFVTFSFLKIFSKEHRSFINVRVIISSPIPFIGSISFLYLISRLTTRDIYRLWRISEKVYQAAEKIRKSEAMLNNKSNGWPEFVAANAYKIAEIILHSQRLNFGTHFFEMLPSPRKRFRIRSSWVTPKTLDYLRDGKYFLYFGSSETYEATRAQILERLESENWPLILQMSEPKIKERFYQFDLESFKDCLAGSQKGREFIKGLFDPGSGARFAGNKEYSTERASVRSWLRTGIVALSLFLQVAQPVWAGQWSLVPTVMGDKHFGLRFKAEFNGGSGGRSHFPSLSLSTGAYILAVGGYIWIEFVKDRKDKVEEKLNEEMPRHNFNADQSGLLKPGELVPRAIYFNGQSEFTKRPKSNGPFSNSRIDPIKIINRGKREKLNISPEFDRILNPTLLNKPQVPGKEGARMAKKPGELSNLLERSAGSPDYWIERSGGVTKTYLRDGLVGLEYKRWINSHQEEPPTAEQLVEIVNLRIQPDQEKLSEDYVVEAARRMKLSLKRTGSPASGARSAEWGTDGDEIALGRAGYRSTEEIGRSPKEFIESIPRVLSAALKNLNDTQDNLTQNKMLSVTLRLLQRLRQRLSYWYELGYISEMNYGPIFQSIVPLNKRATKIVGQMRARSSRGLATYGESEAEQILLLTENWMTSLGGVKRGDRWTRVGVSGAIRKRSEGLSTLDDFLEAVGAEIGDLSKAVKDFSNEPEEYAKLKLRHPSQLIAYLEDFTKRIRERPGQQITGDRLITVYLSQNVLARSHLRTLKTLHRSLAKAVQQGSISEGHLPRSSFRLPIARARSLLENNMAFSFKAGFDVTVKGVLMNLVRDKSPVYYLAEGTNVVLAHGVNLWVQRPGQKTMRGVYLHGSLKKGDVLWATRQKSSPTQARTGARAANEPGGRSKVEGKASKGSGARMTEESRVMTIKWLRGLHQRSAIILSYLTKLVKQILEVDTTFNRTENSVIPVNNILGLQELKLGKDGELTVTLKGDSALFEKLFALYQKFLWNEIFSDVAMDRDHIEYHLPKHLSDPEKYPYKLSPLIRAFGKIHKELERMQTRLDSEKAGARMAEATTLEKLSDEMITTLDQLPLERFFSWRETQVVLKSLWPIRKALADSRWPTKPRERYDNSYDDWDTIEFHINWQLGYAAKMLRLRVENEKKQKISAGIKALRDLVLLDPKMAQIHLGRLEDLLSKRTQPKPLPPNNNGTFAGESDFLFHGSTLYSVYGSLIAKRHGGPDAALLSEEQAERYKVPVFKREPGGRQIYSYIATALKFRQGYLYAKEASSPGHYPPGKMFGILDAVYASKTEFISKVQKVLDELKAEDLEGPWPDKTMQGYQSGRRFLKALSSLSEDEFQYVQKLVRIPVVMAVSRGLYDHYKAMRDDRSSVTWNIEDNDIGAHGYIIETRIENYVRYGTEILAIYIEKQHRIELERLLKELGVDGKVQIIETEFPMEGARMAEPKTKLVVVADEYGRYGEMLMGYPLSYYLVDEEHAITIPLEGDTAEELLADFRQRYPKLNRYPVHAIRDGSTWLLVAGNKISSKKQVEQTTTHSGQVVRLLPEVLSPFDRGRMTLDLSKSWTPNLHALLQHIKNTAPQIYEKLIDKGMTLAYNGKAVTDLESQLRFQAGDEISFLPPIRIPPEPDSGKRPAQILRSEDLHDAEKVRKFLSSYEDLDKKQRTLVDSIHGGEQEREILANYLIRPKKTKEEAISEFVKLGYDRQLASGFVSKIFKVPQGTRAAVGGKEDNGWWIVDGGKGHQPPTTIHYPRSALGARTAGVKKEIKREVYTPTLDSSSVTRFWKSGIATLTTALIVARSFLTSFISSLSVATSSLTEDRSSAMTRISLRKDSTSAPTWFGVKSLLSLLGITFPQLAEVTVANDARFVNPQLRAVQVISFGARAASGGFVPEVEGGGSKKEEDSHPVHLPGVHGYIRKGLNKQIGEEPGARMAVHPVFDENGIALNDEGRKQAIDHYQRAINKVALWIERIHGRSIKDMPTLAVVGSFATMKDPVPNVRLGIFPDRSPGVLKNLPLSPLFKNMPSDIDVTIPYGHSTTEQQARLLREADELKRTVFQEQGVFLELRFELGTAEKIEEKNIALFELADHGLMRFYNATSGARTAIKIRETGNGKGEIEDQESLFAIFHLPFTSTTQSSLGARMAGRRASDFFLEDDELVMTKLGREILIEPRPLITHQLTRIYQARDVQSLNPYVFKQFVTNDPNLEYAASIARANEVRAVQKILGGLFKKYGDTYFGPQTVLPGFKYRKGKMHGVLTPELGPAIPSVIFFMGPSYPKSDIPNRRFHSATHYLSIAAQMAEGVTLFNRLGMVHGDVTYNNFLVSDNDGKDVVTLFDYAVSFPTGHKRPGPAYLAGFASPNQVRGGPAQLTDDVFGLAATLAWLWSGKTLFDKKGDTVKGQKISKRNEQLKPIWRDFNGLLKGNPIREEIMRGLRRPGLKPYKRASEMLDDIQDTLARSSPAVGQTKGARATTQHRSKVDGRRPPSTLDLAEGAGARMARGLRWGINMSMAVSAELRNFAGDHLNEFNGRESFLKSYGEAILKRKVIEELFVSAPLATAKKYDAKFRAIKGLIKTYAEYSNTLSTLRSREGYPEITKGSNMDFLKICIGAMAVLDPAEANAFVRRILKEISMQSGGNDFVAHGRRDFNLIARSVLKRYQNLGSKAHSNKIGDFHRVLGISIPEKGLVYLTAGLMDILDEDLGHYHPFNQRLAMLGDALLGEWLAKEMKDYMAVGKLVREERSFRKKDLELLNSDRFFSKVAHGLNLARYRPYKSSDAAKPLYQTAATSFEAVAGGIYLATGGDWNQWDAALKNLFRQGAQVDSSVYDFKQVLELARAIRDPNGITQTRTPPASGARAASGDSVPGVEGRGSKVEAKDAEGAGARVAISDLGDQNKVLFSGDAGRTNVVQNNENGHGTITGNNDGTLNTGLSVNSVIPFFADELKPFKLKYAAQGLVGDRGDTAQVTGTALNSDFAMFGGYQGRRHPLISSGILGIPFFFQDSLDGSHTLAFRQEQPNGLVPALSGFFDRITATGNVQLGAVGHESSAFFEDEESEFDSHTESIPRAGSRGKSPQVASGAPPIPHFSGSQSDPSAIADKTGDGARAVKRPEIQFSSSDPTVAKPSKITTTTPTRRTIFDGIVTSLKNSVANAAPIPTVASLSHMVEMYLRRPFVSTSQFIAFSSGFVNVTGARAATSSVISRRVSAERSHHTDDKISRFARNDENGARMAVTLSEEPQDEIKRVESFLHSLGLGPGSKILSIGPSGPNYSYWTWEWYFLKLGAELQVYEPNILANKEWVELKEKLGEEAKRLHIVSARSSYFGDSRVSEKSADAVVMMSVLDSPQVDPIPMAMKAARSLHSGGYLILGWYKISGHDELETNLTMSWLQKKGRFKLTEVPLPENLAGLSYKGLYGLKVYQVEPPDPTRIQRLFKKAQEYLFGARMAMQDSSKEKPTSGYTITEKIAFAAMMVVFGWGIIVPEKLETFRDILKSLIQRQLNHATQLMPATGVIGWVVGGFFISAGILISIRGYRLHSQKQPNQILTDNLYAYVRHPIYLGRILMFTGITILGIQAILFAAPFIIYTIYDAKRQERNFIESDQSGKYQEYIRQTPRMIIPKIKDWPAILGLKGQASRGARMAGIKERRERIEGEQNNLSLSEYLVPFFGKNDDLATQIIFSSILQQVSYGLGYVLGDRWMNMDVNDTGEPRRQKGQEVFIAGEYDRFPSVSQFQHIFIDGGFSGFQYLMTTLPEIILRIAGYIFIKDKDQDLAGLFGGEGDKIPTLQLLGGPVQSRLNVPERKLWEVLLRGDFFWGNTGLQEFKKLPKHNARALKAGLTVAYVGVYRNQLVFHLVFILIGNTIIPLLVRQGLGEGGWRESVTRLSGAEQKSGETPQPIGARMAMTTAIEIVGGRKTEIKVRSDQRGATSAGLTNTWDAAAIAKTLPENMLTRSEREQINHGRILVSGPGDTAKEIIAISSLFPHAESVSVVDAHYPNLEAIQVELNAQAGIPHDRIKLHHADLSHLPFEDSYFDLSYSSALYESSLAGHQGFIWANEQRRVLKDGGFHWSNLEDLYFESGFKKRYEDPRTILYVKKSFPHESGARMASTQRKHQLNIRQVDTIYYWAAGRDFETVEFIRNLFPNATRLHLEDAGYAHRLFRGLLPSQWPGPAKVKDLYNAIQAKFELREERSDGFTAYDRNRDQTVEVILDGDYISQFKPEASEQPSVYIIRNPDDSANLSRFAPFYAKLVRNMRVGDYVFISEAFLRSEVLDDKRSGLKRVPNSVFGLPDAKIDHGSFVLNKNEEGLPLVREGWVIYQKSKPEDRGFIESIEQQGAIDSPPEIINLDFNISPKGPQKAKDGARFAESASLNGFAERVSRSAFTAITSEDQFIAVSFDPNAPPSILRFSLSKEGSKKVDIYIGGTFLKTVRAVELNKSEKKAVITQSDLVQSLKEYDSKYNKALPLSFQTTPLEAWVHLDSYKNLPTKESRQFVLTAELSNLVSRHVNYSAIHLVGSEEVQKEASLVISKLRHKENLFIFDSKVRYPDINQVHILTKNYFLDNKEALLKFHNPRFVTMDDILYDSHKRTLDLVLFNPVFSLVERVGVMAVLSKEDPMFQEAYEFFKELTGFDITEDEFLGFIQGNPSLIKKFALPPALRAIPYEAAIRAMALGARMALQAA